MIPSLPGVSVLVFHGRGDEGWDILLIQAAPPQAFCKDPGVFPRRRKCNKMRVI
jgi:hypothetical protein